jgi:hypothetical protein
MSMSKAPMQSASEASEEEPLGFFDAWMRNCRAHFLTGTVVSLFVAAAAAGLACLMFTVSIAIGIGAFAFIAIFFWGSIETDPARRK